MLKRLVAVLMVLVMLGSVVMPAMAASVSSDANIHGTCFLSKDAKIGVIELIGLEKNEVLAKALKNENVKKLMNVLVKKGHNPELAKAVVNKIVSEYGEMVRVFIPFKASKGYSKVGLVYIITENGNKAFAVEAYEKDGKKYSTVYYIDQTGNVATLQVSPQSCIEECSVDCVLCCVCDNPNCGMCSCLYRLCYKEKSRSLWSLCILCSMLSRMCSMVLPMKR